MTAKTRYFAIASLLILVVGLGTGLVAYYGGGFPVGAFFNGNGPKELQYIPSTASVVGGVEVREIMASDLRHRLRQQFGNNDQQDNARRQFQELTGINFETDIERIVAGFDSQAADGNNAIALARGVFDPLKIESLMREHGADVQDYNGTRLIVAPNFDGRNADVKDVDPNLLGQAVVASKLHKAEMGVAFLETGLVAFGGTPLVKHAIDLHKAGGSSAATNDELVSHIREIEGGNAWVVGRVDSLRQASQLPPMLASQIPPISWFSVRGHVDGGIQARITAEAKDDESANQLRDVVRGFLALAKLQTSSKPEFQRFVQSLQLGGAGKSVTLSVEVPAQVFDLLGTALPKLQQQ